MKILKPIIHLFVFTVLINTFSNVKAQQLSNRTIIKNLYFNRTLGDTYNVYYRGKTEKANKRLIDLETFHHHFYNKFFDRALEEIPVILYKTKIEYINREGLTPEYFAHFDPGTGKIYSYLEENPGPLFHEIVHCWVHRNIKGMVRLWFNEGFASFFESPVRTRGGTWQFDRPNWRHEKLRNSWTNLKTFMNRIDLPDDHDKAQARFFFLYLSKKGKMAAYVKKYGDNIDFNSSGIVALEEIMNEPVEKINIDMKNFKDLSFKK